MKKCVLSIIVKLGRPDVAIGVALFYGVDVERDRPACFHGRTLTPPVVPQQ
jgi:hypothetical protein